MEVGVYPYGALIQIQSFRSPFRFRYQLTILNLLYAKTAKLRFA